MSKGMVAALTSLVATVFLAFAVVGHNMANNVRMTLEQRDEREGRIIAWVVERNPQATIKDFQEFPRTLLEESKTANIDFRILLALIDKESQFNPKAIGSSGEIGLMQVLPSTAAPIATKLLGKWEAPLKNKTGSPLYASLGTLGDPKLNVRIGVAYLKDQVNKFGSTPTALRAYNRGEANAKQHRPGDQYAEEIGKNLITLVSVFPR